MAIKLRILHYPDNKKLASLCKEINGEYENSRFDKIPPAYPCENERLLVAIIKCGKEPSSELKMFCDDLKKTRAQNVLYIFDAPEATGNALAKGTEDAGAKLVVAPKFMKFPGLFGKFNAESSNQIRAWIKEAYDLSQG